MSSQELFRLRPSLQAPPLSAGPAHSHHPTPFSKAPPTDPGSRPSFPWESGCRRSTRPADLRRRELGDSFSLQPLQLGVDVGQSSLGQSQPLREARGREEEPAVDTPSPLGAFILPRDP